MMYRSNGISIRGGNEWNLLESTDNISSFLPKWFIKSSFSVLDKK